MVDFGRPNYTPMEQEYHQEFQQADTRSNVEEPIFPINVIGQTVPETDPTGKHRNIVEGVDAAFRAGAGNIQLVMQQPGQAGAPGGGGPRSYGEDVRQAIREIQEAAGAKITGVELPTSISNLSGFNPQQNVFSEEQRKFALDEVRDSIKFVGDISGGGGVDIVAFEFPRGFSDTSWGKEGPFKQREEDYAMLVNKETGRIMPISKKQTFFLHKDPKTLKIIPGDQKPVEWEWSDFQKWGEKENKSPEKLLYDQFYGSEVLRLQREAAANKDAVRSANERLKEFEGKKPEELSQEQKSAMEHYRNLRDRASSMAQNYEEQAMRQQKEIDKTEPVSEFGKEKSVDSYSQTGIWAMQESEKNKYVQHGKGAIHVGPEMGWPQYYGSHPREWVELIKTSREEMVRKLTDKSSDYYDPDVTKKEAEELAKKHIKGELDTSHMGMWLQSFKTELPWDERVKEFKKWYKEQIEYLAEENKKHDLIGGIQVVDSASGAHGHLPPGQGVLGKDLFEYMKILKEEGGYEGDFTSEGHEEEKFGQGRILTKAWETLNAPISMSYIGGRPAPMFRDVRNAHAMQGYASTGIFQSYVPSNDFTLWSQVPLE